MLAHLQALTPHMLRTSKKCHLFICNGAVTFVFPFLIKHWSSQCVILQVWIHKKHLFSLTKTNCSTWERMKSPPLWEQPVPMSSSQISLSQWICMCLLFPLSIHDWNLMELWTCTRETIKSSFQLGSQQNCVPIQVQKLINSRIYLNTVSCCTCFGFQWNLISKIRLFYVN